MALSLYKEDLVDFFERSNQPNIFPYKEKGDTCLQDYEPSIHSEQQSIKAIKGIVDALIHLRLNLITPTQLPFVYVIGKNKKWGLRHAICERGEEVQHGNDCYNPEEYSYHSDPENELMWNIGKVWLRFFTRAPIKIKYQKQQKIDEIVNQEVKNKVINKLILKLLTWKPKRRITFQQFLAQDIFIAQQQEEQKSFYTSILGHIKTISNVHLFESKAGLSQFDNSNAYAIELRYRCFLEYLEIDLYFEHLKIELNREFNLGNQRQKCNCQFTKYMIGLQNYFNFARINSQRLEMGDRFQELEHRLYFSKFAKRMVQVRDDIEKKAKRLRNNNYLKEEFKVYLKGLDDLDKDAVYDQLKSCLNEYAQLLNEDLRKDDKDIVALRLLVKIYIIRTSRYLFSEMRTEVFEPFLNKERFNIKKVLVRINQCKERNALKQLLMNIKHFYFKQ